MHIAHWHSRALIWLAAIFMLIWGGAAAWLQWWLYPHLDTYRPRLVAELSQRVGRPIEIGRITGGWRLAQPRLSLGDVVLKHQDGRVALTLKRADATLAWWPLVLGQLRFDALTLVAPELELTRDEAGTIRLADIPLNEGKPDTGLGDWLLRQHSITIENGQLSWSDAYRHAPTLTLTNVNFSMANRLFGSHDITLSATPPVGLAAGFTVQVDWRGDELAHFASWHGTLGTALTDVDLAAWGKWLPYPVEVRRGRGRVALDADFLGTQLSSVDGALDVSQASLRLAPELQPLDVAALSGKLAWREQAGNGELKLTDLKLSAEGGKLLDGTSATLQLYAKGGGQVSANGLTLPSLANLPPTLPLPNSLRKLVTGLRPAGRIDQFNGSWEGDWREPAHYSGRMAFVGLGLSAPAPWPTLGPLDGELAVSDHDGQLTVDATHFRFAAKDIYDDLALDQLHAALDWNREGDQLTVRLNEFNAQNVDIAANAKAVWRWNGKGSGDLALDANIPHLTANKVGNYLPLSIGPDTRQWLSKGLLDGEARDARFKLAGPLDKFPFAEGGGVWSVVTKTHGVTLDYAHGWPRMEGVDGEVRIDGDRLEVNAGGRILGTRVEHANAVIEHLGSSNGIAINGAVAGPVGEFFRYIAQSPLDKNLNGLGSTTRADGEGHLNLRLDIPFDNTDNTKVAGDVHVAHGRLQIGQVMPEVRDLNGDVHFTESDVTAHGLVGQVLGGAAKADLATDKDGAVLISATGRADLRQVMQRFDLPAIDAIGGSSDYHLQLNLPKSGVQIALSAPMTEAKVDLPAPVGKRLGETRPLRLALDLQESSERWRVDWGSVSADVSRSLDSSGWHIDHGDIAVGNTSTNTARKGLWLDVNLPELALDPWIDWVSTPTSASGLGTPSVGLAGVELRSKRLGVLGRRLDDVTLHMQSQASGEWGLNLASQEITGQGNWNSQGRGRLYARLDKLSLPLPAQERASSGNGAVASRRLPAIDLAVSDFSYNSHGLGALAVKAQQNHEGWLIDNLSVENPDGKLSMQGLWKSVGNDDFTDAKVSIDSANIGKLLDRFGYGELMRRGKGSMQAAVSWHGSPMTPDYPSLTGTLSIKAENGQFAKVDPGVGRLLGVLSLQSLQRRLTLDFRDIFSEGFAFDKIEGDSKVTHGVLATDNLTIVGPAAHVSFKGEADLASETQNLRVRIIPTVGDSVAVGAGVALANPVVGVGVLLLQRVLKDPLGRLVAYEYDVTGSWADPQVARVAFGAKAAPEKHAQAK